jgi:inosine-uridine nucleoside N-ribohydrolase
MYITNTAETATVVHSTTSTTNGIEPNIALVALRKPFAPFPLLEAAGRYPGEVELVTLAPLTNVAIALHKDPSFAEKVKGCVMMCGASDHLGNITPVAEYNAWVDPEAAKVVFSSGMPIKMVGLDVSRKHASFTPDEAAELRGVGTRTLLGRDRDCQRGGVCGHRAER